MNGALTREPKIVGLEVGRYKNLRDVWLPWSDGIALFGSNGSGNAYGYYGQRRDDDRRGRRGNDDDRRWDSDDNDDDRRGRRDRDDDD